MIFLVLFCGWFTWYQINNLETGIIDVCATQQDAYVQLVLDQINLKENRADEEIINDILSTLDSSANKYWTFSKDRSMLFVKDVIETNRYKGLTAGSYYNSESAIEFLDSLETNRVIHRSIEVNGKKYVASGVAFEYGGKPYRLCLLTNKDVFLSNNRFLKARIEIVLLVAAVLIIVMVVSLSAALRAERVNRLVEESDHTIKGLQGMVGHLNEMLSQKEQYDTRHQMWSKSALRDFLTKLRDKGAKSAIALPLHFKDENEKLAFLARASVLLDNKVLRFMTTERDVLLLFLKYNVEEVEEGMKPFLNQDMKKGKAEVLIFAQLDIDEYMKKVDLEVANGYQDI